MSFLAPSSAKNLRKIDLKTDRRNYYDPAATVACGWRKEPSIICTISTGCSENRKKGRSMGKHTEKEGALHEDGGLKQCSAKALTDSNTLGDFEWFQCLRWFALRCKSPGWFLLSVLLFQKAAREGKYIISICSLLKLYGILSKLLSELNSWFNHPRVYWTISFFFELTQKDQGYSVHIFYLFVFELLLYAR